MDRGLEVQLKALELKAKQDEDALRSEMVVRTRAAFPASEMTAEEAADAIDDFVLPPLRALGRSGVVSLAGPDDNVADTSDSVSDDNADGS